MKIKLVGNRVAFELALRSLTQAEIAEKAHVARGTISGIVNGRGCYYQTAAKIAEALGLTIQDLQKEVI